MKKIIFILFCLITSIAVLGQNEKPRFITSADHASDLYADNSVLLKNYVMKNLNCPRKAAECCIEGTEIIRFVVTPSGEVTDFNVIIQKSRN